MKKVVFLALLSVILGSCSRKQIDDHDQHGVDPKIQLTAYNDSFEVFVEADPFVMGDTSNVLAHFSHLANFKPLDSGRVTIKLVVGSNQVSQVLDRPTRKGIYSFNIVPPTIGSGSLSFEIESSTGSSEVIIASILVYSDESKADSNAISMLPSRANTVTFTKEQSWKIEFATALPVFGPFGQIIRTTAQVLTTQSDEVMVVAKTSGIVTFGNTSVVEGASVMPGHTLCSITGSGLADNNSNVRFIEAQNRFLKSKANYERQKELAQTNIVSQKDLESAKAEYENARATFEVINDNFNPDGQLISSPVSGFVKKVFVSNGQFVETGQTILSISKNKNLLIRADVQQKFFPLLDKIQTANIRNLSDNRTYTLEDLNGKLLSYGKSADEKNYLIPVIFQIENTGGLMPGGFVELYLKTLDNHNAVTVPNTALLEENGNHFVLVQITPELFEKREVILGTGDGFRTEIKEGLEKEERIIIQGTILVKLAQASGALDAHAGHVH